MSKQLKKMEMDALKKTFGEVRDLVLLSISGVPALAENQMRLALRKKNIRLHTVKNSLLALVLKEMGMPSLDAHLQGPTTLAWGSSSIADLCKEIDSWHRKNTKIKPKVAVADGAMVGFDQAKRFPTRAEAIANVVALALGPARRLASQILGPASQVAGQIKTISEKAPAPAEAAPAEPAAPA
jgi:large subunit ribosomal protein L10